ncbi:WXG100 family type VII secretion target [Actinoplanes palleronii]|uniref:PPE family protein n=1 Tax=Actinoplanes palleronii TaxID=113570 RepID=A0ABQ4B2D4_9ACTN|nr:hypothetical protein [Actinoplanes palleronii]GIE64823.1 hypothetical protein Apa02nite_009310 [Actinoplanes palleronii]
MANYFGFSADPNYGYSPYSGYTHYKTYEPADAAFTPKAGEGNELTFEAVQRKIKNMHPEDIAALADQWDNAVTFLEDVKSFVAGRSTALQDEWTSPKAAAEFLKRGPGETLGYLDMWIAAAQTNRTALRHLVTITREARQKMDLLEAEYRQKLTETGNLGFFEHLGAWVANGQGWDAAGKEEIHADVDQVAREYRTKAQDLAYDYGNQYFDYLATLSTGTGPPVQPMNAVLNNPGSPSFLTPPGLGSAPPPPVVTPGLPLPLPPPINGSNPAPPSPNTPGQPGTPPPGTALPNQPGAPPVGAAGLPPGVPVLPPGVPGRLPGGLKPGLPPPGLGPGATGVRPGTTTPALPPNPGQLGRNSFGRGTAPPPGLGQPPGRTLRRGTLNPAGTTSPPAGRLGDRRRGDAANRVPGAPVDGEKTFGRGPGSSAPPVLKNPAGNRERRRPGSTEDLRPDAKRGSDAAYRPDGTTSPMVNRPTGPALPPQPARRRGEPQDDRRTSPWADYFGTEQARAGAGSGTLEAPGTPPAGSFAAGLEDVPRGLRSQAATRSREAPPQHRPGTVAPELGKRRTSSDAVPARHDDEADAIVTDERAFEVPTPGGGVMTGRSDEPPYEPEIRRILGGGR